MRPLRALALALSLTIAAPTAALAADDDVVRFTTAEKNALLNQRRDPATAAILSGIFPGVGHVYAGNLPRGAIIGGAGLALVIVYAAFSAWLADPKSNGQDPNGYGQLLGTLGLVGYHLWNVRDAFYTSIAVNQSLEEQARQVALPPPPQF